MVYAPNTAGSPESSRVRLARIASGASLRCSGVAGLDQGPTGANCTWAGQERLPGVLVMPSSGGDRYSVSLFVRAHLVDLFSLARQVRHEVVLSAAAEEDALSSQLDDVEVTITDIVTDGAGADR